MSTDLPSLIGSDRLVAIAEPIRERFLLAMEHAEAESWFHFQGSRCDAWVDLMQADLEQSFAFNLIRAKTDANWWIARRQTSLPTIVWEALAGLSPDCSPSALLASSAASDLPQSR